MNATVWKSATSINGDDDITELSGMNEEEDPEDAVIASGNVAVAEVWRMATVRLIYYYSPRESPSPSRSSCFTFSSSSSSSSAGAPAPAPAP